MKTHRFYKTYVLCPKGYFLLSKIFETGAAFLFDMAPIWLYSLTTVLTFYFLIPIY